MARDIIHYPVKNALIKDGWTITADPFTIKYGNNKIFIDLAAERVFVAERNGQKIVVEIKSFVGASTMQDFKAALGQYILYMEVLAEVEPEYQLCLAMSDQAYQIIAHQDMVKLLLSRHKITIIVVDVVEEEVTQWIN